MMNNVVEVTDKRIKALRDIELRVAWVYKKKK
jgi:hypothetical protein